MANSSVRIFCVSRGFSGMWAFSREALQSFAPSYFFQPDEFCSGEIWEADLNSLNEQLWAFSYVLA